jgi:two-component system nitrogen regulation sensor histidine kinase NtrY
MSNEHRFRTDRLILFSLALFILVVSTAYFVVGQFQDFSWPFITNSVLMLFLGLTNVLLILVLLYFLFRNLIKVLLERKKKILGSQFKTRMVFAFLVLCLIPSGIIFWVAMNIIQSSVERWFNTPADEITDLSQQVVDAYYETAKNRSTAAAERIGREIERRRLLHPDRLPDLRENLETWLQELQLDVITLYPKDGAPVTAVVPGISTLPGFEEVPEALLTKAIGGDPFQWVQPLGGGQLVRAGIPVRTAYTLEIEGAVLAGTFVPRDLTKVMLQIHQSVGDYRQAKAQKEPIKKVYLSGFALVTLVVIFLFTWIALTLARGVTNPILSLVHATRQIASGNLKVRVESKTDDELGTLVESFNRMTEDLEDSKQTIEKSTADLQHSILQSEERRRYIETLLERIATGVISLNEEGRVTTINREALRILGIADDINVVGLHHCELLARPEFAPIAPFLDSLRDRREVSLHRSFELTFDGKPMNLAVSVSSLRDGRDRHLGLLLVLEDLTQLVRAQKVAAWREVAQRLAHEIKNPLTPIQLSAQRIHKKYLAGASDLGESVEEGTQAIIREVASLKHLVDEFSSFARLPTARPHPADLQRVIESALSFYNGRLKGEIAIEPRFQENLPNVNLDEEQIKRVFVNLIDNAIEALDQNGRITVTTSYRRDNQTVRAEVADDGPGIPVEDRKKLFLPYFSTRKRGTGLGLAIVQRIVSDHNGTIRVEENRPRGTRFVLELPV